MQNPITCTSSAPNGVTVLLLSGSAGPCGTTTDSDNGDGIADRVVLEGYIILPDGATSVEIKQNNLNAVSGNYPAGAAYLAASPDDDPANMVVLGGSGSSGSGERLVEVPPIELPPPGTGCVALQSIYYRMYIFDGHATMAGSMLWRVRGGAADNAADPNQDSGGFAPIPTTYLSSVAGYSDDPNGNGTPDYQEVDNDGDGITDWEEMGFAFDYTIDIDGDGSLDCAEAPQVEDDDSLSNSIGDPVTIDVLGNDPAQNPNLDPTTVMITDPSGNPVTSLAVAGEGTWDVDPTTGEITFTPEPGFEGDPTPITYTAADTSGVLGEPASVTVDYVPTAVGDESLGNTPGDPVTIDVVGNDADDIDPTSVMITDPSGNPVTSLAVAGEGTWDVDPTTGEITFTPEPGFEGNPTPITYTATDALGFVIAPQTVIVGYADAVSPNNPASVPILAFTGVESRHITFAGLLLFVGGIGLVLYARRKEDEVTI